MRQVILSILDPNSTLRITMPTNDDSSPKPLSQSSVASFVFGTFQIVIIIIAFAVIKFIGNALTAVTSSMGKGLPGESVATVSYHVTFLEVIALLLINVLPLMGLITGFSGLASITKGYGGAMLAQLGLMFSLLAIVISVSWAILGDLEPLLQVLK